MLEQPPNFSEGEMVEVMISSAEAGDRATLSAADELREAAGSWADEGEELDAYLEWNRQQRKLSRPEIEP
ncbi:MAG: hypothetical protein SH850_13360 [Planctomycetaceae bacterium]|nr:hypothetical protein [Planctomycetaceae bacterium]